MRNITLQDKFDLEKERVFLSGTQALVRLCLLRHALDKASGLSTAGYVTGYRGSPLGGLDQQFPRAQVQLDAANIVFEPALNEDLAATAVWGTQQAEMRGEGAFDGVFSIWYGKGPGVDRSGDVLRHGNLAGSSPNGGVLVIMGDDHTCESSTTAHQSEFALKDAMIPIFNPATVSDIINYGLHGWELSRYAGTWCGLKCVKDNIESTASINNSLDQFKVTYPQPDTRPSDGLNIRTNDHPVTQEARLHQHKLDAVRAYVKENRLDHRVWSGGANPRLGIISTGKSWQDTRQALEELGIDEEQATKLGVSIFKVAMPWPLEPSAVSEFCRGLDQVIVVEEKRGLIEDQLKAILFGQLNVPSIVGKRNEQGDVLFQSEAALNPVQIAQALGQRIITLATAPDIEQRLAAISQSLSSQRIALGVDRKPWFCAGCPHNSSTVIPEGARAYAGIGCHWMVQFMERNTEGYTHMGGEGANWIGESRFSTRRHVFQNLGDGTYNHSGLMAIRAAIAADTNITFKLLFNDAVAMTGGQTHDGGMDVKAVLSELVGFGVKDIALVTDNPSQYNNVTLPGLRGKKLPISHRSNLQAVQKQLSAVAGVTVLVYEQTCAAEKRRRRKRGTMDDPAVRVVINESVCEGCGDCGKQSNCVAILPLETALGRKRAIDQSACNKDLSCLKGFCPSFVSVHGGELRKPEGLALEVPALPDPVIHARVDSPYAILITGVGGTGVVTIGALLGMAAHIDGLGCGIIDMAGLAQKGGSVVTHLKLCRKPEDIQSIRVATGGADLLLGCDLLVSNQEAVINTLTLERSIAIVNSNQMMPPEFTRNPDLQVPVNQMHRRLSDAVSPSSLTTVDATGIASSLLGDTIAANLFMLGVAWQRGLIPVQLSSILKAIELNGVAVAFNVGAFGWGRAWVVDASVVHQQVSAATKDVQIFDNSSTLEKEDLIQHRMDHLRLYQNSAYADRYASKVAQVRLADSDPEQQLTEAIAHNLHKLMAYKDEYEVARLHSDGDFEAKIDAQFSGDYALKFHLAPPLFSRIDPATGRPAKREFGSWVLPLLRSLARLKRLRGTPLDIFGYTTERKTERRLIRDYVYLIDQLLEKLSSKNITAEEYSLMVSLARLPEKVRGFGVVKNESIELASLEQHSLLEQLKSVSVPTSKPSAKSVTRA